MNYGQMRHAEKRGVENLRKSLKEKVRREISRANTQSHSGKFAIDAVLGYIRELEEIAYKKGSNFYNYQKEGEDGRS